MEAATPSPRDRRWSGVRVVLGLAAFMWILEVVDVVAGHRLDSYGIEPRDTDSLAGILAAPFLHAGFGHLLANTIPFLVLGIVIALGGALQVLGVTAIVALVSGLGTWVIGPEHSIHIGASGVVFGYATFLLTRGLFNRDLLQIVIGLVVGVLWGASLLAGLEPQEGISWQGHLFGAVGGVLAARVLRRGRSTDRARKPERLQGAA